jgi:hypothetical protein
MIPNFFSETHMNYEKEKTRKSQGKKVTLRTAPPFSFGSLPLTLLLTLFLHVSPPPPVAAPPAPLPPSTGLNDCSVLPFAGDRRPSLTRGRPSDLDLRASRGGGAKLVSTRSAAAATATARLIALLQPPLRHQRRPPACQ